MKSPIKFLFLLLFVSHSIFAQDQTLEESEEEYSPNAVRLLFDIGLQRGFAVGDGFLNDSYSLGMGVETGVNILVLNKFIVGGRYDIMRAWVRKPEMVGSHKHTTIHNIGGNIGYLHSFSPQLDLTGMLGWSWASYAHRVRNKVLYYDHAAVASLQLILGYNLTKNFGFYFSAKGRYDNMRIESAPEMEDYFKDNNIFSLGLGIRIKTN